MQIILQRFQNEHLGQSLFKKPSDIVTHMLAVQSQDYTGAVWGLAQRGIHITQEAINTAFNNGEILRTHIMRPTWHFVVPEDIGWLTTLTAPSVKAVSKYYFKKMGVTEELALKSRKILEKSLKDNNFLTRDQLKTIFEKEGIQIDSSLRMSYLIIMAELDAVVTSGPRIGKQFSYALFKERVAKTKNYTEEEALAQIAIRYYKSHGPATIKDLNWWSGLSVTKVKQAISLAGKELEIESFNGKDFYFHKDQTRVTDLSLFNRMYLLPNYDEFTIAFKDREVLYSGQESLFSGDTIFYNAIIYKGVLIGTWKKTPKGTHTVIEAKLVRKLTTVETNLLKDAIHRYEEFLRSEIELKII